MSAPVLLNDDGFLLQHHQNLRLERIKNGVSQEDLLMYQTKREYVKCDQLLSHHSINRKCSCIQAYLCVPDLPLGLGSIDVCEDLSDSLLGVGVERLLHHSSQASILGHKRLCRHVDREALFGVISDERHEYSKTFIQVLAQSHRRLDMNNQ